MKNSLVIAILLLMAAPALGAADAAYTENVGQRVRVFESEGLNYRLDLEGASYTYIDFSTQVPDASFAAIRFRPNAFSLVVVEDLGPGFTSAQYAEIVVISMAERLAGEGEGEFLGATDIGLRDERGMQVFQKTIRANVGKTPITYVVSAIVDGPRAYQLLTFASNEPDEVVRAEADRVLAGFSIIEPGRNDDVAVDTRRVDDYRSPAFGYRFRARGKGWYGWSDLEETKNGADFGALSALGYGSVVMPVCWRAEAPGRDTLYRVMMQQFGEDYPSAFITEEKDIEKGGAEGKLLAGIDEAEGEDYLYLQWIVANARCAYTLAAWGPAGKPDVRKDLEKLWKDFEIRGEPQALDDNYETESEREVNAYLVNAIGLHFYESRSFRDAFRHFEHASDLSPADEAYVVNAVRSLIELEAFEEATAWLANRIGPFAENQAVQSWDAWLAYQTGDSARGLAIYSRLFEQGYRDDDDFTAYMTMLADVGRWDELDREFERYAAGGESERTRQLQVQLLTRRERYDEALALLDRMTRGRPFNADLAFERIAIYEQMERPADVLRLAQELIDNGYRSMASFYYKGAAEYQLRSYREARASFEQARSFAPANASIKEYLDAIDHMLGEGDTTAISQPLEAVALPRELAREFDKARPDGAHKGYGAVFLSRITGYDFDGDDTLVETMFRKIHVLDSNGVAQFSTLEFDFDPAFEQLYVNRLVVMDEDGEQIAEGDLNSYYLTNSESGYEASTEKTVNLPVPSLAPGTVVEAVVTKRSSVERGSFPLETVYLSSDRPILHSAVFVRGNHDKLRFESRGVREPRRMGDALVWKAELPIAFRWEPLQPYFDQILPWVQLGTVSESWAAAGQDYLQQIHDKLETEGVAERARRLVEGVDSVPRQVEILSAYVQDQIRYEAIEFGRRAYIPKTARETLRDRYGDCKDHAVLLYALLEAVGIDATLALVNLSQQVLPGLPNTDQFDHMIVAVGDGDDWLFVDATDKDLQLGKLPPRSMAGNFALTLGDEPRLIRIPDYESSLTGINVERAVEFHEDTHIEVTESARFTGYQAAELRGQLRNIESSDMQGSLQRWIATRYSEAELIDYSVDNIFDAGYDLLFEIRYSLPLDADGTFDVPGFLEGYYLDFERVADRRFPFEHLFPLRMATVTSLAIPDGRKLDEVAKKPERGESRFGQWQREVRREDGGWEIRFDFVASEERFSPEEYREFSEFQRKAIDAVEQPLLLQE